MFFLQGTKINKYFLLSVEKHVVHTEKNSSENFPQLTLGHVDKLEMIKCYCNSNI